MKKSFFRWCLLCLAVWGLFGCQRLIQYQRIDPGEIPDKEYNITVHESYIENYAVLFDIPGDGSEVVMIQTSSTKTIGRDRADKYLDRFKERVRFYRALAISDQDGTVTGYLVASNSLAYDIYFKGDRILIWILDPALGPRGA